jgi:hypothetical protein
MEETETKRCHTVRCGETSNLSASKSDGHTYCEQCLTERDYIFNDKDLHVGKGYPGSCSGNLLAWLSNEMGGAKQLDFIAYIEAWGGPDDAFHEPYRFCKKDFDFKFDAEFGSIEEIEQLVRFVMRDGSTYIVERCDGEYRQTGLIYQAPVARPDSLNRDIKALWKKNIRKYRRRSRSDKSDRVVERNEGEGK